MSKWEENKRWSDRFLPEIKAILGGYLIGEPPMEEDAERNTDLMVLRMEAVRIGCRVRRHKYLQEYGHQFTIRAGLPSGFKTELTKIVEGWGDYFFYGFSDEEEDRLQAWFLGDMKVFRRWYMAGLYRSKPGVAPGERRKNTDNSSSFVAFNLNSLPPEFIIGRSSCDRVAAE